MVLDDEGEEADAPEEPPSPDETLSALVEAEAEVEAIDARFAAGDQTLPYEVVMARTATERRRRGSEAWGLLAIALAVAAWAWPTLGGFILRRRSPSLTLDAAQPVEGFVILAAVVCGTVGCRRVAGKRLAFVGRAAAWSAPAMLWLIATLHHAYRGEDEGNVVIATAGTLVWVAMGLFVFAIVDALIAP